MILILISIAEITLIIYAFYNLGNALIYFLALCSILNFTFILINIIKKPRKDFLESLDTFFAENSSVFIKYHLFFRYPKFCKQFSSAFSGFQILSIIGFIISVYLNNWLLAVLYLIIYLPTINSAIKCNPEFFLSRAVFKKNNFKHAAELAAILDIKKIIKTYDLRFIKGETF